MTTKGNLRRGKKQTTQQKNKKQTNKPPPKLEEKNPEGPIQSEYFSSVASRLGSFV